MRTILHSDINSCYASIECQNNPSIRNQPVAVGGDVEQRHGIILAKNDHAKKFGIKTGEALWQAKQKCPKLVIVPPNFPLYLRTCGMIKEIYDRFSPQQESFGIDESWIDVTGCGASGETIANQIRDTVKREIGITVSVGVSWNKIFAKLGSDYKKPDAVTSITQENYKEIVWPLPASDLLYVGSATTRKLAQYGIHHIGDIAKANPDFLRSRLGKMGIVLHSFANGQDNSPVTYRGSEGIIKSIGNSTTTPKDMTCDHDLKITCLVLCESVSARLRESGLLCRGVQVSIRDVDLQSFERQCKIDPPTMLTTEILETAMRLFRANWRWQKPLRSVGVRAIDLIDENAEIQLSIFEDNAMRERLMKLEHVIDETRARFGYQSIRRGISLQDRDFGSLDAKGDNTIHPVAYFKN